MPYILQPKTSIMIRILSISIFLFFVACNSSNNESTIEDLPKSTDATSNIALDDKKILIDGKEDKLTAANSLTYTHNDGSYEEALAFLDDKKNIVKVAEKFTNGITGNSGTRTFYLENNKKFMSVERFLDNEKAKGAFRERISYYDKNGSPISTKERLTQFEENIEKEEFKGAKPYDCSMETAEQVLNNKGVFATTFQGFIENGDMTYLLVGGRGKTGYASALAIQFVDDQIDYLRKNETTAIGKPLTVEFERMRDQKNMEFQLLINAKMD